jgi:hypothetical protein
MGGVFVWEEGEFGAGLLDGREGFMALPPIGPKGLRRDRFEEVRS